MAVGGVAAVSVAIAREVICGIQERSGKVSCVESGSYAQRGTHVGARRPWANPRADVGRVRDGSQACTQGHIIVIGGGADPVEGVELRDVVATFDTEPDPPVAQLPADGAVAVDISGGPEIEIAVIVGPSADTEPSERREIPAVALEPARPTGLEPEVVLIDVEGRRAKERAVVIGAPRERACRGELRENADGDLSPSE